MDPTLSGAHAAGDSAFGASTERPGVGRTPHDDRLFALGYPYLLVPTDEPVAWPKMQTMADVFRAHPLLEGEWPAELFEWVLARWDVAPMAHLWSKHPARTGEPASHDIDQLMAGPHKTADTACLLFALEAVHGSRRVAERAVEVAEGWSDPDFGHKPGHVAFVRALHFVLLRVELRVRAALVDRLEAVFDRVSATCRYGNGVLHKTVGALDLALHGRAGVERSGYRPDRTDLGVADLPFALDDPDWVAEVARARIPSFTSRDWAGADARLGFLGGDAVVRAICDNVRGFHSSKRKRFVAQMGRFAHPAVRLAIEVLAGLAGAKREAKAWLKANG